MIRRRASRVVLALVGALLALGPVAAVAIAAPVAPDAAAGACNDAKGITVVVDATAFGDGVKVRCAAQPVRSGFEALAKAGFTYQGTTQFPGLLCRIDGEPASDPCHGAPPPDAYWAYWHAPRGGDWIYSTSGAGSRVPPPGSVEGWAFGDDAEPGIAPPAPTATTTTTRPPTVTTQPAGGPGGPSTAGAAPTTTRPAGAAGTTPTSVTPTSGDVDTTTTVPGAAADPRGGADGGSDEQAGAPPNASGADGGSPWGVIIGLAAVAGLGTAALVVARRRRTLEGEPA